MLSEESIKHEINKLKLKGAIETDSLKLKLIKERMKALEWVIYSYRG